MCVSVHVHMSSGAQRPDVGSSGAGVEVVSASLLWELGLGLSTLEGGPFLQPVYSVI